MTTPSVSVIIPVYNGARYVAEAIHSVLTQTRLPAEIIVVDDGSTDDSASIIARLSAEAGVRLRYAYQPNQGPSAARNIGVQQAAGDLLALLDADDVWLPTKLARQAVLLEQLPDLGYVGCHLAPWLAPDQTWPATLNRAYWESRPPSYTTSALLIRRAVWEQVGPFDVQRRLGEDADWIMRARDLAIPAAAVSEVLLIKRIHDQNLTHQAAAMRTELLDALHQSVRRKRAGG